MLSLELPNTIRVSLGTLEALGLAPRISKYPVGVAYLLMDAERCWGTCKYCPLSRVSKSPKGMLSRVFWPSRPTEEVIEALKKTPIRRVCLQTVIKRGYFEEALALTQAFKSTGKEVSVSIMPLQKKGLEELADAGADYIGVGVDAASERVAAEVGRPGPWLAYWAFIADITEVLGEGRAIAHIIVGLGETFEELVAAFLKVRELGGRISLFAYTPVKGTPLAEVRGPPPVTYYRLAQLTAYLIEDGHHPDEFLFLDERGWGIREEYVTKEMMAKAVLTRGCPGCNRPFYNERPGQEPFNFPARSAVEKYIGKLIEEVREARIPRAQPP